MATVAGIGGTKKAQWLEAEYARRNPQPHERVLLNLNTGKLLRRPRLYAKIQSLGVLAGVPNAHPHRFRDSFAVDLLCAGAGVYDVARMLGDTVETVEKHHAPFVPALRERLRRNHGKCKWVGKCHHECSTNGDKATSPTGPRLTQRPLREPTERRGIATLESVLV